MKSTVIEKESKRKIKYPCLKIVVKGGDGKGPIVLFSRPDTGVVIRGVGDHETGEHATNWAEDACFIPFDGQVILEND
ncbi:MAG: hypothetical protein PHX80_04325 [Candidatus Nanoarchaeia archaeon]|nr:hypothetical protein [Candidatus Nanoarchaeia archaeon]